MRERICFEKEINTLLGANAWASNFSRGLPDAQELEFEVKKSTVTGHVAWAKAILNKLQGSSLPIDNRLDDGLKKSLVQFQAANNIEATSKLDFKTERALLEKSALSNLSDQAKRDIISQAQTRIEDWMSKAVIKPKKKHLILNQFRDPRTITSLVLHHMAYKARDKRGNLSNPEVYLGVGAHFCIMLDGRIMQHHPVSRMIWHSNCTSPRSVGVEFEGNFPDIKGKWWYPTNEKTGQKMKINEDVPTQAQFEAGRFLLSYLNLVIGLKHVLVHRQSSKDRENDPGPDIWFNVGEWALANLGISDGGKNFKCGDGFPIQDEWRNWNKVSQKAESRSNAQTVKPASKPPVVSPPSKTPVVQSVPSNAVAANRIYAERLGWAQYIHQINDLLLPYSGLSNVSLGEAAFVEALKLWQKKHGLGGDGVLGPKTWAAIKHELKINGVKTSQPPSVSPPRKSSSVEEIINGEKVRFAKKTIGWAAYGGGKLRDRLIELQGKRRLDISPNEIEYFSIVSIPESGGLVNAINSWDSAYMSMGFFQFPIKFNKLQRVIQKAPEAFRKHGIELDGPRIYIVKGEKPIAIKNAAKISDLRSYEWAVRFYKAGLEDDAIAAQISVAREILNNALKRSDSGNYLARFKNAYPNLWAFIFEADNSRPAPFREALKNATKKAAATGINAPADFGRILIDELKTSTRNYYGRIKYDKDPLRNEALKQARINDELAKVGRIIAKTKITTN